MHLCSPTTVLYRPVVGIVAMVGALTGAREASAQAGAFHAGATTVVGIRQVSGIGGGLSAAYGLSDAFDLVLLFDVVANADDDWMWGSGSLGVNYLVDFSNWAPYVALTVGAYDRVRLGLACERLAASSCHDVQVGGSLPIGLDYRWAHFALGGQGRLHVVPGEPSTRSTWVTLGVKAEWLFSPFDHGASNAKR